MQQNIIKYQPMPTFPSRLNIIMALLFIGMGQCVAQITPGTASFVQAVPNLSLRQFAPTQRKILAVVGDREKFPKGFQHTT